MASYRDEQKIKSTLDLARCEINRQRPELALEHLSNIRDQIDMNGSPIELAEYSLLLGEAFCAKRAAAAETYLDEAHERITSLSIRQLDLEVRLYERLGEFFASVFKKPTKAKEYFSRAKSVAVEMGVPEATARIELKIILADLVSDRDPELENFKLLRRVAANSNYTCDEQLAAWHLHLGDLGPSSRGLRFARKLGTANEQYFSNLLESVRMTRK